MSVYMKLGTKVRGRDMVRKLSKSYGIRETRTRANDPRERCLTDGRHSLWVYLSKAGVVDGLVVYGMNEPIEMLDTISKTFDTEIYTEHDPQYYGCNTQEEWEAAMPDVAGQMRVGPCETEPRRLVQILKKNTEAVLALAAKLRADDPLTRIRVAGTDRGPYN